jgi:hypothetical protein
MKLFFTMIQYLIAWLILFCCAAASAPGDFRSSGFPEFTLHHIDSIGRYLGQSALADVDNDGDLDWIAGEAPWGGTSRLWWWEYRGPDDWHRHLIGKADSDVGGDVYDLNNDGWIDFWSGKALFINRQDGTFDRFEPGTTFAHDSRFADIDGDGRVDGVANSDKYGLVWYSIPEDPTQAWTEHMIDPAGNHKIHGGPSPQAVGDLDGDGDADVVTGRAWYENLDGAGRTWKQHKTIDFGEADRYGLAVKTWMIDLDGDGDLDFVQSEADHPDARVAWFENDGKGNLTRHIIKEKGDRQDFHGLIVADFDNDGDWDVCAGGGPLSGAPHQLYIWENHAGKTGTPVSGMWKEHKIASMPSHEIVGGDVDGDGDIDICLKPWTTGNRHGYLQNRLK